MTDTSLHPNCNLVGKLCMSQEDLRAYCRPVTQLWQWRCSGAIAALLSSLTGAFVVIPAQYAATEARMLLAKRIQQALLGAWLGSRRGVAGVRSLD